MKSSIILLALSVSLAAQDKFEYWPGASYDPGVPTEKQVIGHDPGDRVTRPQDIVKYMEALAAARPHQMRVLDYGKTWEGRRLIYCAVSSEANIKRLDEIPIRGKRPTPTRSASWLACPPCSGWLTACTATKFHPTTPR